MQCRPAGRWRCPPVTGRVARVAIHLRSVSHSTGSRAVRNGAPRCRESSECLLGRARDFRGKRWIEIGYLARISRERCRFDAATSEDGPLSGQPTPGALSGQTRKLHI